MNKPIYDEKGKVIGFKLDENDDDSTYLDERGRVVARVRNDGTYDSENKVRGKGDQGLKFL